MILRFKKWRKQNNKTVDNIIKAESYYNKAFIELQKQNNEYTIVCSVYNIQNYTILAHTGQEALKIYNNVKMDFAKIIDMSICCFNEEIQKEILLIDCSEFESKYRTNI